MDAIHVVQDVTETNKKMASKMRKNKRSLLESIEEVSEVSLDQDCLQDLAEPSALTSEQPPHPQRQFRQTHLISKDSRVSLAPRAHKNGNPKSYLLRNKTPSLRERF